MSAFVEFTLMALLSIKTGVAVMIGQISSVSLRLLYICFRKTKLIDIKIPE